MRRAWIVGLVLGGCVAACQLIAGIDRVDKEASPNIEAAVDAGTDGARPEDPCKHASVAPRPAVDDDPEKKNVYVMAFRTLGLTGKTDAGVAGRDIDGVCTCDRREGTAEGGASPCTPRVALDNVCDDDGGIDNASARLFTTLGAIPGSSVDEGANVNGNIANGVQGALLYVSEYNGRANDREVLVGIMLSYGIIDPGTDDCASTPNTAETPTRYPPTWCGRDKWSYSSKYVQPSTKTPVVLGAGYVSDYQLVFSTLAPIKLFIGESELGIGSPTVTARLLPRPDGKFDATGGLLTGRLPVNDLLAAFGAFRDPASSGSDAGATYVCRSPAFEVARQVLCNAVDLMASPPFDFQGAACNAISTGVTFEAAAAEIGSELTVDLLDHDCAPGKPGTPIYDCPK
ncbi:MAG: hypothetical protein JST00_23060 [Deltaproteobacteria bacterium]|nr:hypothetical protein [Deltaproteobacteria bacterium]